MKILVIGGAGFIGSHTVDRLLSLGHKVRILDSLEKPVHQKGIPKYLAKEAEFFKGDIRDRSVLTKSLKGIESVFHFTAFQDNLPNFSKYFDVNATATALIYEIIIEKKLPVKKIVVASSQAVMGEGKYKCFKHGEVLPDIRPIAQLKKGDWEIRCPKCSKKISVLASDESVTNPQNQYAISKYAQEMIALNLGKRYQIPTTCLRYSIVQGARQSFYNPYSGACRIFSLSLMQNRPPEIYEDGKQLRDFINIRDVVRANILVFQDKRADYQVFNVGGGKAYTILEFYQLAKQVFESSFDPIMNLRFRFGDTRHIISDTSKLEKLSWKPKYTPINSLEDYRDWLLTQPKPSSEFLDKQKKMKSVVISRSNQEITI